MASISNELNTKGKRGKNFSEAEKEVLLELIETKKQIFENKETSAKLLLQKQRAWDTLVELYNSQVQEPRTKEQLKTLYENIKRNARKKLAVEHREKYMKAINQTFQGELNNQQVEDLVNEAVSVQKIEKTERRKTGGGKCEATTSDSMSLALAIMGETVHPMKNSYDSAANYYDCVQEENVESIIDFAQVENSLEIPDTPHPTHPATIPTTKITFPRKKMQPKGIKLKKFSAEQIKKKYYLQKLQNVKLERQLLLHDIKKKDIEIKILKKQL